ncbi:MAG: aminopeptidase P family protein [Deltaproteobacteria bacterium]|nr:aminopeptidase P family protein [Deltaproteobacteria bacterium]MBW1948776.1 aminopeptidase P family protein [Deltaproteobacteria bacterium]MBW2006453.1 aminopeptidase P family protein [Deltaproteobacteria bacterium]MBW2346324.1 aminopeptidase P family protein [Deltaproteobacteria bacterium]
MQEKSDQGKFHVPADEIHARTKRIQAALRRRDIEAMLVVQRMDLFYFSGTAQRGWLFIPTDGDPLLMIRKYAPRARRESALEPVPEVTSAKELPGLIRDFHGRIPRTLGLEFDVIPVREYMFYQRLFPGTELVDASPAILEIRTVKSPWEIARIEETAGRSALLFDFMRESLRPGMSEMEYSGVLEARARKLGHASRIRVRDYQTEGYSWHILSGESGSRLGLLDSPASGEGTSPAFPCGAGYRPLRPQEPIMIDFTFVLNGYHVDETRMFSVGPMPEKARRGCEAAIEIHNGILDVAEPGIPAGHIYETARRLAQKLGVSEQFLGPRGYKVAFVGHGVGLELVEPPLLAKNRKDHLKPGMVFSLEPKLVFEGEFTVGIESVIQVTESACRLLTRIPVQVFIC